VKLEIIAHRGFSAIAPENTIAAFTAAIEHQAEVIEFDVQLSSDRVPVIIHDTTVDRTSDGTGYVFDKMLEQLKALDAGTWFNTQFTGEQIPTLREALEAVKDIRAYIIAEVKNSHRWLPADVENFVNTIISEGWEHKSIVACFKDKLLEQVRELSSRIILGYLVDSLAAYKQGLSKAAADGNAVMLSEYHILLENPELVESSRSQGVDVVAWTVDSEEDLLKLTDIGVVRIVTNSLISRSPGE